MESLLPLVGYLACPLGMGLMMWMMMRNGRSTVRGLDAEASASVAAVTQQKVGQADASTARVAPSRMQGITRLLATICFDWRVIVVLAALGVAIFIVAPGAIAFALPVLLIGVCPLSMLLTMRMRNPRSEPPLAVIGDSDASDVEPEERLAELRGQLATAQSWEDDLRREIAELEGPVSIAGTLADDAASIGRASVHA